MYSIKIISGPINSGKTTALFKWTTTQSNIDGILQPVIDGKRFLFHIKSKTLFSLETTESEDAVNVGKYRFSLKAFNWANERLIEAVKQNFEAIVFDEIGRLELQDSGLASALKFALNSSASYQLILAVRENLLDAVIDKFNIENPLIIREFYENI
ncbi:nucleoside-triphosphatase [Melioribacter sp. OK-6-Me]|uniref:nucleoside-triphosphatase n=1 Tax=unclassified Melioribacter TaxID=2627329 RepID=UPI003EDA488A